MKAYGVWLIGILMGVTASAYEWQAGEYAVSVQTDPLDIVISAAAGTVHDTPHAVHQGDTLAMITAFSFDTTLCTSIDSVTTRGTDTLLLIRAQQQPVRIIHTPYGLHFSAHDTAWQRTGIVLKDRNEHFCGITEQNIGGVLSPDLRGDTVVSRLREYEGEENYANAHSAFYMSSAGYGGFFDTFARGRYVFGVNGRTVVTHETGTLDWYLLYGPDGAAIHRRYFALIGALEGVSAPKYVPMWACGPGFWRNEYRSFEHLFVDVQVFDSLRIPMTFTWLDRPYSNGIEGWGKMDFSDNFADPGTWIDSLRQAHNLRLCTWIMTGTFGDTPCVKCFEGKKSYVDLSDPQGYDWFTNRIRTQQHAYGVQGHKMDRGDQEPPLDTAWYDGTPRPQRVFKYQYLYAKVTGDMLQHSWGKDQFNFARSTYHRSQPYLSAVWNGDSQKPWKGLKGSIANAQRAAFMGFPVWGSDVGGYFSLSPDKDALLRWMSFGAWSGLFEIMLDYKSPVKERYSDSLFQHHYRRICTQRMRLLPYIYSIANSAAHTGTMMQPLAYRWPHRDAYWQIWDQYMFGPAFLVAPMYSDSQSREVVLPPGRWYDFHDPAQVYQGDTVIVVTPEPGRIPVFAAGNSIHVTGNIYRGNAVRWYEDTTRSLFVHVRPGDRGDSCAFTYVDYLADDEHSRIRCKKDSAGVVTVHLPAMVTRGVLSLQPVDAPSRVEQDATHIDRWSFDEKTRRVSIPFAPQGQTVYRVYTER